MTPRWVGLLALVLLAAYAGALLVAGIPDGPGFVALAPFPLGGFPGDGGLVVRGVALTAGLLLGWGIPGMSLALLTGRDLRGAALLARAFGLGVAYLLVVSLGWGLVTGHAPHRVALLVALALPNVLLVFRSGAPDSRRPLAACGLALAAMMLLTAVLWPKLRAENLSGDGTELYEWSRSLESHPLPHWDLERRDPPGAFGTPVVAAFSAAPLVFAEMNILGRGELAARLPFVIALVILAATAAGFSRPPTPSQWIFTAATALVYVWWHAWYVGNEPAVTDLAESAGTDALTAALWFVGVREAMAGSVPLGIGFMTLASVTTMIGPVLMGLTVPVVWFTDRERGRSVIRWTVAMAFFLLPIVVVAAWWAGVLPDWVRQFRGEFLAGYLAEDRRLPALPILGRFLLSTACLPLLLPFVWGRLSASSRALALVGAGYLAVVLAGGEKNVHYLAPLPWIFLVPALDALSSRVQIAAAVVLAVVFVLSWPDDRAVHRDAILLGRESCVSGLTYEAASLAADPVYQAFDWPATGDRFGVGKHTFVRYAMDLGGADCVVGLSPATPPGAVTIAESDAMLWTTDPDRYARWRFLPMRTRSSILFPSEPKRAYSADPAAWTRRLIVNEAPARALLISGFDMSGEASAASGVLIRGRARLLVPVSGDGPLTVTLGLQSASAARLEVTVNGVVAPAIDLGVGHNARTLEGNWRRGWNVLELRGGEAVGLQSIEPPIELPFDR